MSLSDNIVYKFMFRFGMEFSFFLFGANFQPKLNLDIVFCTFNINKYVTQLILKFIDDDNDEY